MEIIIISGRSGAGKSVALRALEDMGYYCVDNLPLNLLPQLTQILANTQSAVAISLDIRNLPHSSADLDKILTDIQASYSVKIIFLDSEIFKPLIPSKSSFWTAIVVHLFVVTAIHVVFTHSQHKISHLNQRLI